MKPVKFKFHASGAMGCYVCAPIKKVLATHILATNGVPYAVCENHLKYYVTQNDTVTPINNEPEEWE